MTEVHENGGIDEIIARYNTRMEGERSRMQNMKKLFDISLKIEVKDDSGYHWKGY